ncbi:hypothetical protein [Flavobacterium sp.]|uniref:hypothetical protein n=1 Tax=Flavobacterium sp. TaxID=239 RepID=UPI003A8FA2ED
MMENKKLKTYYKQFFSEKKDIFSVIIDDDGSVAYAYLLEGNNIISDLWLYNSGKTKYEDWENISEKDLPLQNLDCYIITKIKSITNDNDIDVEWYIEGNSVKVEIYIHNKLIGILNSTSKVGFNTLVSEDTPIAKKI